MGNSNPHGFSAKSTATEVTAGVDLTGKVALITGANTGIGKETAKVLAMRGARVIIGCRDQTKGNAAVQEIIASPGVGADMVECLPVDLNSFESVRAFAKAFLDKNLPLHLLILNAGIMIPPFTLTQDGFESTFGVNHLAHFLLTSLLIEKLKASAPARVVVLASMGHKMGDESVLQVVRTDKDYNSYKAYGNSKLANILFAVELNKRLAGTEVSANALHPGVISTELARHSSAAGIFYFLSAPFTKTIPQGASTTCFVATHPSITPANSGQYFCDNQAETPSKHALDANLASQLWTLSEQLTGVTFLAPPTAPAAASSTSAP